MIFCKGYIWYSKLSPAEGSTKDKQQTWIVERDSINSTNFRFQSVYWKYYYLTAEEGNYVYVDKIYQSTKWMVIAKEW